MVLHHDHESLLVEAELENQLRRAFYVYSRLDGTSLVDQVLEHALDEGEDEANGMGARHGVRYPAFLLFARDIGLFRSLRVDAIKQVFVQCTRTGGQNLSGN